MSRVDVPTLKCDRCGDKTQDTREMGKFKTLTHYHMSGQETWDLCQPCWGEFTIFVAGGAK